MSNCDITDKEIYDIIAECCGTNEFDSDTELYSEGLLDSFAVISMLSQLEDRGIFLEPTQLERYALSTPKKIISAIRKYQAENQQS